LAHLADLVYSILSVFINNEWVEGEGGKTIDVVNPTTGKVIGAVSEASVKDVDRAVDAAEKAFNTTWGETVPGWKRGQLLTALAAKMDEHAATIGSIESQDNGKAYSFAKGFDVAEAANCLRYYAGWADKNHGKTIEVHDQKLAYTRHEPMGVVGQIIPWNFPIL
jgi:aldehyde dehydrogenase (NAD+)